MLSKPLHRLARGTIDDPADLRVELEMIRLVGYALLTEETYDGAADVGVHVFDQDGHILASLAMTGPIARVVPLERWAESLRQAARQLEAAIGGHRAV